MAESRPEGRMDTGPAIALTTVFGVLLLVLNFFIMMATGMLALMGGPLFWYGQFALSLGGIYIFWRILRGSRGWWTYAYFPLAIVAFIGFFFVSDHLTVKNHERETRTLLDQRHAFPLPAGCAIGDMLRGAATIHYAQCEGNRDKIVQAYLDRPEGWRVVKVEKGDKTLRRNGDSQGIVIGRSWYTGIWITPEYLANDLP